MKTAGIKITKCIVYWGYAHILGTYLRITCALIRRSTNSFIQKIIFLLSINLFPFSFSLFKFNYLQQVMRDFEF